MHRQMHDAAAAVIQPNLTPPEASTYLEQRWGIRRKVRTLAKMRCVSSDGPVFLRVNRAILYPRDGLDAYAQRAISAPMRSTSDGLGRDGAPNNLIAA